MICPKCGNMVVKARLDVYWCVICNQAWLIHKLSTFKTLEEARKTWEQDWKEKMKNLPKSKPPKIDINDIAFPPRLRSTGSTGSTESS